MESLEQRIEDLEKQLSYSESIRKVYENGDAKLYYALQRKMSEMAQLLNKTDLNSLLLEDPKDKTFERLKVIWNDSASLSAAIKELGMSAGVTGDEQKDTIKKPFVETIAEVRK